MVVRICINLIIKYTIRKEEYVMMLIGQIVYAVFMVGTILTLALASEDENSK